MIGLLLCIHYGLLPFASAAVFSVIILYSLLCGHPNRSVGFPFDLSFCLLLGMNPCCVFSQRDTVQNLIPKDHSSDSFFLKELLQHYSVSTLANVHKIHPIRKHTLEDMRGQTAQLCALLANDFALLCSEFPQLEAGHPPPAPSPFPNSAAHSVASFLPRTAHV